MLPFFSAKVTPQGLKDIIKNLQGRNAELIDENEDLFSESEKNKFSVVIIPYTLEHTNFKNIKIGDRVNLEFDIIGKYVQRMMQANQK